ncbi:hypothetical protein HDU77_001006 [Chytriomyces hyalinus]|nr:hypothetical protein HDU77_001006 [Chytriomyces hyalinus]
MSRVAPASMALAEKVQTGHSEHTKSEKAFKSKVRQMAREIASIPLSDLPVPKGELLDPLLGRMTTAALTDIFESELKYCLKAMDAFSKLDYAAPNWNSRRQLILSQFRKCWDQYGVHLSKDYTNVRLVETGEALLHLQGFHDIASLHCFEAIIQTAASRLDVHRFHGVSRASDVPGIATLNSAQNTDAHNVELWRRSQFGNALCSFLAIVTEDPTLKTPTSRSRILKCLQAIAHVTAECSNVGNEWLVLEGSKHTMTIAEHLWDSGLDWVEILQFVETSIQCIEHGSRNLQKPEHVSWISKLYTKMFQNFIACGNIASAKDILSKFYSAIPKFLGNSATLNEDGHPVFLKFNELLFSLSVKELSSGQPVAYTQSDNSADEPLRFFNLASAPMEKVVKFNSIQADLEPRQNNSVCRQNRRQSFSMMGKLKQKLDTTESANDENKFIHPASILRHLSATPRVIHLPRLKLQFPDLYNDKNQSAIRQTSNFVDLTEEHTEPAYMSIPASVADTTIRSKRQLALKSKKPKGLAVVPETEEHKQRRLLLADIILMLRIFNTDAERLHVLNEGLNALLEKNGTLASEKPSELSPQNQLYRMLLDIGFELLISDADSLVKKGGFLSTLIGEVEAAGGTSQPANRDLDVGKLPNLKEITKLIQNHAFGRFYSCDVMNFCRILFRALQWERYIVTAQILDYLLTEYPSESNDGLSGSVNSIRELTLRAAFINFHNIWHAERKVLFNVDASSSFSGTSCDLRGKRFGIPTSVHDAAMSLLNSLSDCLESATLVESSPRLFLDSVKLLWSFIEQHVEDYLDLSRRELQNEIEKDDTVLRVHKAIHVVTYQFLSHDVEFAVRTSLKLAYILENTHQFEEAQKVLRETLTRITECRGDAGDGSGDIWMLANHSGIQADPSVACQTPDQLQLILPVFEIEVARSIFRCDLKRQQESVFLAQRRKDEEYERLTNKRAPVRRIKTYPSEKYTASMTGGNLVLRSVLFLVYASNGFNLEISEKHALLKSSAACLRKQKVIEKYHIDDANSKLRIKSKCPSMKCPPPTVVRRSPTSITLLANHMVSDTGYALVPATYQGYCKEFQAGGKVALNDTHFPGTGEQIKASDHTEITVYGLEPGKRYIFAIAAFDESGQVLGRGIGESTKGITAMYSLPLVLCWSNVSLIAHELFCDDIADEGYLMTWNHFVKSSTPVSMINEVVGLGSTGVNHAPVFELWSSNVGCASIELSSFFVQCVHKKVDRAFAAIDSSIHSNAKGVRDTLKSQQIRLGSVRDLLVAAHVSKKIRDWNLLLSTSVKMVACLLPFFEFGVETPFAVHAMIVAHECIILCEQEKASLDPNLVTSMYRGLVLHLVSRLLQWKEYSAVIRIANDSLKYLSMRGAIHESPVHNSAAIEHQWTGLMPRTKRYATNRKKNIILNIQADNVYQLIVATSANPKIGYAASRKRIEVLREQLDFIVCHCSFSLKPPTPYEKRYLDQQTSLKEIYHVFISCGPEVLIQELAKFKKNPRYLEIISKCVNWSLKRGFIDQTLKICNDTFDWLTLRTRFLATATDVMEEGDNPAKEALLVRVRRTLYPDKRAAYDVRTKSERKSRSRTRVENRHVNSLVDGGIARQKERTLVYRSEVESVSPTPSKMSDPSTSRPTSKDRDKSKSRSPSAEKSKERESKEGHATMRGIGRKRKRLAQKTMILAGLQQSEKDKLEKAVHCLDGVLGKMWKRKRALRRLRTITIAEASYRAAIARIHGTLLLKKLGTDFCGKDVFPLFDTTNTRVPSKSFGRKPLCVLFDQSPMAKSYVLPRDLSWKNPHADLTVARKTEIDLNKAVGDIFQSFVQSIVHSGRAKDWRSVLNTSKQLWNISLALIQSGLVTADFQRDLLWKPHFIVGETLMELLESTVIQVEYETLHAELSGRRVIDKSHDSEPKEFQTYQDLVDKNFNCSWVNIGAEKETMKIDLLWCAKYLAHGVENMINARLLKRAAPVLQRFNRIFKGVFAPWSEPLAQKLEGRYDVKLSQYSYSASQDFQVHLMHARSLFNMLSFESLKSVSQNENPESALSRLRMFAEAFEAYGHAMNLAKNASDPFQESIVCNEFGDLWHANNDLAQATYFWSKGLEVILGPDASFNAWNEPRQVEIQKLKGPRIGLLVGVIAFKLGQNGHNCGVDRRHNLFKFSAQAFSSILSYSAPHPSDPLLYAKYSPAQIIPCFELFSDQFMIGPELLAEYLYTLSCELLSFQLPVESLIMSSLLSYVGGEILMDNSLNSLAILSRAKALMNLGFVQLSLHNLNSVFSGSALLQNQKHREILEPAFNPLEPLFSDSNWDAIRRIAEADLDSLSKRIYNADFIKTLEMYRCDILLDLLMKTNANDPASANTVIWNLFKPDTAPEVHAVLEQMSLIKSRKILQGDITYVDQSVNDICVGPAATVVRTSHTEILSSSLDPLNQSSGSGNSFSWDKSMASILSKMQLSMTGFIEELESELAVQESVFEVQGTQNTITTLLKGAETLAKTFILKCQYDMAVKSLFRAQLTALKASKKYDAAIDAFVWLQVRFQMAEYSFAAGLFHHAKELSEIGVKESHENGSWLFDLRFRKLLTFSLAMQHSRNGDWEASLLQLQNSLVREKKAGSSYYNLAETWCGVGDLLSIKAPGRHEAIEMAYDQSEEYLKRFLHLKSSNNAIPLTCHSTFFAKLVEIKLKRALQYQNACNYVESHNLISEAMRIARKITFVLSPSLWSLLTLSAGRASAQHQPDRTISRLQHYDHVKRHFANAIVSEIATGGCDCKLLRSAFEGLLAISVEEGSEDLARRVALSLSKISEVENYRSLRRCVGSREAAEVDFGGNSWVRGLLSSDLSALPFAQYCSQEDQGSSSKVSLGQFLDAFQDVVDAITPATVYTTDAYHASLKARSHILHSIITASDLKLTVGQDASFSNILFVTIRDLSNLDVSVLAENQKSPFIPPKSKLSELLQKPCIQWLNLPVRVTDADEESVNDRLWNVVICFALSSRENSDSSTSRMGTGLTSGNASRVGSPSKASRRSSIVSINSAGKQRESFSAGGSAAGRPMSAARRGSAAFILSVGNADTDPSSSGARRSPLYTTKVATSLVEKVVGTAQSAMVALRKYSVSRDEAYLKVAESDFRSCLESIVKAILRQETSNSASFISKLSLSVETLESIANIFSVTQGYAARTKEDFLLFAWLQQLVSITPE